MQDNGLVTSSPNCVNVSKGQQIGLIGATGNVIPPGDLGAHIHFMVVQDKNNDGDFDDNIPDGITDPFGWQSTESDPWPNFQFFYGGQQRTGNSSYYLWEKAIENLSQELTSNGGFFELERLKVEFPQDATNEELNLEIQYAPLAKPTNILESIGATFIVTAKNTLGQFVEEFTKPYTIKIDFSTFDLASFNLATISIYSSEDGVNWKKEDTNVDLENREASAHLNHLSHFALMAERLDTVAPTTTAILSGQEGETGKFRSNVHVTLEPQDNTGGLGVDYTLFRLDGQDWQEYSDPIVIEDEGDHSLEFYSVDNDENIEEIKSMNFLIDKTQPEAKIQFDPASKKLEISGIDQEGETQTSISNYNYFFKKATISDEAGNTLSLVFSKTNIGKSNFISVKSLNYNNEPKIFFDFNSFYDLFYTDPSDDLLFLNQTWYDKNDVFISLTFKKDTNQSIIYKKVGDEDLEKEILDGLILLSVQTNNGNLEFSY
jgi:hypothetical protein